jgi:hypothetical protein
VDLGKLNEYIDSGDKNSQADAMYKKLVAEARNLTAELRRIILELQ